LCFAVNTVPDGVLGTDWGRLSQEWPTAEQTGENDDGQTEREPAHAADCSHVDGVLSPNKTISDNLFRAYKMARPSRSSRGQKGPRS
jgi:hypothetical protein